MIYTSTGGGSEKFNKGDQVCEIAKCIRAFNMDIMWVKVYVEVYEIKSAMGRVVNREWLCLPIQGLEALNSKHMIGSGS